MSSEAYKAPFQILTDQTNQDGNGGSIAIDGPGDGSSRIGIVAKTPDADHPTAPRCKEAVLHGSAETQAESGIALGLSGVVTSDKRRVAEHDSSAAAENPHSAGDTDNDDNVADLDLSPALSSRVGAVQAPYAGSASDSTPPLAESIQAPAETTTAPFPEILDTQDHGHNIEEALAAEPSLAHHASAMPEGAGHGRCTPITVQMGASGERERMVFDGVAEDASAAQVANILARRLNLQASGFGMEIGGQEFSGEMTLPKPIDPSSGVAIVICVNDSIAVDPVDLSAPSTPKQLQVVV